MEAEKKKPSELRSGFTTGSCASAAAKAAAYMLLSGKLKNQISIETPKGITFCATIERIMRGEDEVSCAVMKDGGDDPDVTTGAYVFATVKYAKSSEKMEENSLVHIDGGKGVGRVTKPGLDQPVGNAAINSTPRKMIAKEVAEVMELFDCKQSLSVVISVEGGEEIAQRTFNPRLGIVGGISILGTSGVVEPMSEQALIDTIRVELKQKRAFGDEIISISPGNYGLDFMKKTFDFDLDKSVKCSNFIGVTMSMIVELGFKRILLSGHIGKLIKVAGGIMNTHSRESDSRMEIMCAHAALAGAPNEVLTQLMQSVTTEDGIRILREYDEAVAKKTMDSICEKVLFYLNKRLKDTAGWSEAPHIEVILFSNEFGLLALSSGAKDFIDEVKKYE